MTETQDDNSGLQVLRPRARILRTLGDELISSEAVAIIELVKNAYDADATRVMVRFLESLDAGKGVVEIIDNGNGMSLETVRGAWMEPATPIRRTQRLSERFERRLLGEKGVGRFAASRLSNQLEMITRRTGTNQEVVVAFDWSRFDDAVYLDEVEIPWERREPVEICSGGTLASLWKSDEQPGAGEMLHGTILRMSNLRTGWRRDECERLRTALSRLVSPIPLREPEQHRGEHKDRFDVYMELPPPLNDMSGMLEPPEALKNPHYWIRGHVDCDGSYRLELKLRKRSDPEQLTSKFVLMDEQDSEHKDRQPQCGPFDIELRVWDRESSDLSEMAEQYGSTVKDIRGVLDKAAGVNVYRDGFRTLPYGEPGNDWLQLDSRRVNNPTLRLSNNQIVGFIHISADTNPDLRDQSNREGIMAGQALDDLRELIVGVLSLLEQRRYADRRPEGDDRKKEEPGGLFSSFNFAAISNLIRERYPEDAEMLSFVGQHESELRRRAESIQEVLARYHRLATLGQLIDAFLHEGRAPLSKIRNEVALAEQDTDQVNVDDNVLVRQLTGHLRNIDTQAGVMATVFRRFEPFSGRKRGRPSEIHLEAVIATAFSVLEGEIAELGVKVSLPSTDTVVRADDSEIQQVVVNLLQNSLYWLRGVPKDKREIVVQVDRDQADELHVLFSDSGPGVRPEDRDFIFDPYYSTKKPNGVGLGLTIAGEIVKDYYAGDLDLLDSGPLPGATFRAILRRRI